MRVFAPGKLVLTGAYAVLEGAPAIVLATTRGAIADGARVAPTATPEVRAALGDAPAPHVDASALFVAQRKLGLGASSAILVASLAVRDAEAGNDLGSPPVRDALFARARAAHAEAQGGGSGVDVAASVHGGVLRYVPGSTARIALPKRVSITVFACATSARTSHLRAEVDRFATQNPTAFRPRMNELARIADEAVRACEEDDAGALIASVHRTSLALDGLGSDVGFNIVPDGLPVLGELATSEEAAFCVAGAGGGDVVAFVGTKPPSPIFLERAHASGLFVVDVEIDERGVRVLPERAD